MWEYSMFKSDEIHCETPNQPGQRLLRFSNRIINLEHVTDIEQRAGEKESSIVFRFSNATEWDLPYKSTVNHSLAWKILEYCVANNLYSLELSKSCIEKWGGYKAEEDGRPYS
jgi:hypothetical protein